jgi:hypothetical protein
VVSTSAEGAYRLCGVLAAAGPAVRARAPVTIPAAQMILVTERRIRVSFFSTTELAALLRSRGSFTSMPLSSDIGEWGN